MSPNRKVWGYKKVNIRSKINVRFGSCQLVLDLFLNKFKEWKRNSDHHVLLVSIRRLDFSKGYHGCVLCMEIHSIIIYTCVDTFLARV